MSTYPSPSPASLARIQEVFTPELYSQVYDTWYNDLPHSSVVAPEATVKKWFGLSSPAENAALDELCTKRFKSALSLLLPDAFPLPEPLPDSHAEERRQDAHIAAPFFGANSAFPTVASGGSSGGTGGLTDEEARNALGFIILLDQMPRNIFRANQAVIYNHLDRISRAVTYTFLSLKPNRRPDTQASIAVSPIRRIFWYLPLMHSEWLEDHVRYSELMSECRAEIKSKGQKEALDWVDMNSKSEEKHVSLLKEYGRYPHRNEHLGRVSTPAEQFFLDNGGTYY
ncbi:hypothetical protein HOO65_050348 [Ceratocystis lukuohia]|uniref:DUF924-domain-containing protein n=3 Tax=Ceratocystis TaxID=5157 RepID=A0A0F8DH39_CERFI|nr:hypothetical protein CFO_g2399 [Ceratocystis platani]PHH52737.1 hypothetical protein CFIMG_008350RA00001 [Ceratocystis fimbriata CBS 114723]